MSLPHPIPYQGSKRRLAPRILDILAGRSFETLYEPFAGSAAITIAGRARNVAGRYVIGDSLDPLIDIWTAILCAPEELAATYAGLWHEQMDVGPGHFNEVRAAYNAEGGAARLLYLLARCVKNAPRWNKQGGFSQSADNRRRGMRPTKMTAQIGATNVLLSGVTSAVTGDAAEALADAGPDDLVYMDPPWQGTTEGADTRYHQGFARARLEALLVDLNERDVPWLLSYDGRSGDRVYGPLLPGDLYDARLELAAGRSSQATLNGRDDQTIESLYVSPALAARARCGPEIANPQYPLFAA